MQTTSPPSLALPPELDAEVRASEEILSAVRSLRALEVPLARRLAVAVRDGHPFADLAGSVAFFGHLHGLGPSEIHRLVALGFLLEENPEVETPLVEARLSLENASLLHDLYLVPSALREGEDWLDGAVRMPTSDFRKKVEKRLAEVAEGGPVAHVGFWISSATRRRFERARDIASRKAGRRLTRPETFGTLVDDYLRHHDPLEGSPRPERRTRRARAGDSVPESVKRDVRRRFGDRCAVSGCPNTTFLEIAHLTPRALGGSNGASNLLELCRPHHEPFDAKRMFLRGCDTARPWFEDRTGHRIGWLRTALDPGPAR